MSLPLQYALPHFVAMCLSFEGTPDCKARKTCMEACLQTTLRDAGALSIGRPLDAGCSFHHNSQTSGKLPCVYRVFTSLYSAKTLHLIRFHFVPQLVHQIENPAHSFLDTHTRTSLARSAAILVQRLVNSHSVDSLSRQGCQGGYEHKQTTTKRP